MAKGIEITIQALAKSKNKAANRLLDVAITSSHEEVRKLAGREVISGNGKRGIAELIRNFDPNDPEMVDLFQDNREKAIPALRAAILGADRQLSRNALRIANTQKFFELIPLLLTVFMDQQEDAENGSFLSDAIMKLLGKYAEALEERKNRRLLYRTILPEILNVVSRGVRDFHRNDPILILRVYLILYPYIPFEDEFARKILRSTSLTAFASFQQILMEDDEPGVFHLIEFCFDNPDPPPLALNAFAKRTDRAFLAFMFGKIRERLSVEFEKNIRKIEHFVWMDQLPTLLPQLRDEEQSGLVRLLEHLDLPQERLRENLTKIFRLGRLLGRQSALDALSKDGSEQVSQLIWQVTEDAEPEIQATALRLLKARNMPQATSRILHFVSHPNPIVRETVQQLLPEFRFNRFIENFDQMTEEQRRMSFNLVKKMDSQTIDELSRMLMLGQPLEKAKALLCVQYGGIVGQVEDALCSVLAKGELPTLRCKAAELLAEGRRELSRGTLVQAYHRDPNQEVRSAAKASLERRPTPWSNPKND